MGGGGGGGGSKCGEVVHSKGILVPRKMLNKNSNLKMAVCKKLPVEGATKKKKKKKKRKKPTKTCTPHFLFLFLLKLQSLHILWELYTSKIKSRQNLSEENKFLQRFISIR